MEKSSRSPTRSDTADFTRGPLNTCQLIQSYLFGAPEPPGNQDTILTMPNEGIQRPARKLSEFEEFVYECCDGVGSGEVCILLLSTLDKLAHNEPINLEASPPLGMRDFTILFGHKKAC